MIKVWSELRAERVKEQVADLATLVWVLFWGAIVWEFFQFLAGFAEGGRLIRTGGQTVIRGGRDIGESLSGLPLVGAGLRDSVTDTFQDLGEPLSAFGTDVERFILVVAAVLALILALVTIGWWLNRYFPWRWQRLQRLRSSHHAIRRAANVAAPVLVEALALRAFTRLDYQTLLDYTPDPLGDWASGRYDRLARAELASVGLRPILSTHPTG